MSFKIKPKTGFETYTEMKGQALHHQSGLRLRKIRQVLMN